MAVCWVEGLKAGAVEERTPHVWLCRGLCWCSGSRLCSETWLWLESGRVGARDLILQKFHVIWIDMIRCVHLIAPSLYSRNYTTIMYTSMIIYLVYLYIQFCPAWRAEGGPCLMWSENGMRYRCNLLKPETCTVFACFCLIEWGTDGSWHFAKSQHVV